MIPKLHRKGTSFRGAADYLLHDKGAKTSSDRVAWTECRNLATDSPDVAWRVMAATASDAERKKLRSGVRASGRRSRNVVLHLTLSWSPEEAPSLTRSEMSRAADGALLALGAMDRQVLVVCHKDEPQPHVHLLVNRVSSLDGRTLSSSYEKLALSAWAQAYEEARQRVVCPERVENNRRRSHGEFVRGKRDRPRQAFERSSDAWHATPPIAAKQPPHLGASASSLLQRSKETHAQHRRERRSMNEDHKRVLASVDRRARRLLDASERNAERKHSALRTEVATKHDVERLHFQEHEATVVGRLLNRVASLRATLNYRGPGARAMLTTAAACLSSAAARAEALIANQKAEFTELERRLESDLERYRNRILAERDSAIAKAEARHRSVLGRLLARQALETVELGQLWATNVSGNATPLPTLVEREVHRISHRPDRATPTAHSPPPAGPSRADRSAGSPSSAPPPPSDLPPLDFQRIRREREAFRSRDDSRQRSRGRSLHLTRGDDSIHW